MPRKCYGNVTWFRLARLFLWLLCKGDQAETWDQQGKLISFKSSFVRCSLTQELKRQRWSVPSAWREREAWKPTHRYSVHSDTLALGWAWSAGQRGKGRRTKEKKLLKIYLTNDNTKMNTTIKETQTKKMALTLHRNKLFICLFYLFSGCWINKY